MKASGLSCFLVKETCDYKYLNHRPAPFTDVSLQHIQICMQQLQIFIPLIVELFRFMFTIRFGLVVKTSSNLRHHL